MSDFQVTDTFFKAAIQRSERSQKYHYVTKAYRESRWPFTDQLTPDQIVLMRDTYAGRRQKPTALETKCTYDQIFNSDGLDQRKHRCDRQYLKGIMRSAQDEERLRIVPLSANSVYGKRHELFYDIPTNKNRRVTGSSFFTRDTMTMLPPLVGLEKHPHLPRHDHTM